jgi:hypothetical protein
MTAPQRDADEAAGRVIELVRLREGTGADVADECMALCDRFGLNRLKITERIAKAGEVWRKRERERLERERMAEPKNGFKEQLDAAAAKAEKKISSPAQPEIKPAPEIKPKAAAPAIIKPRPERRDWSEVQIPVGATALERLTYVPGLCGDGTNWITDSAPRPCRLMSLGVMLVVLGTIGGRLILGPSDSATHLYIIIIGDSGFGKGRPLAAGKQLLLPIKNGVYIGTDEFASSPGFMKRIADNPLMACFIDELGDELRKVASQAGNPFVSAIIGLLKKCYNAWEGPMNTAWKAGEKGITIWWPAVSIVGAATPDAFFSSIGPGDLESGFANRLFILPYGYKKAAEREPLVGPEPPKGLVKALLALPRQPDDPLDQPLGAPDLSKRLKIGWGVGAKDVYMDFSRTLDQLEGGDRKRYLLSLRGCENAVRAVPAACSKHSQVTQIERA